MTVSEDERILAMLIYVISFFTAIIGPLLIWLLKRKTSYFVDHHGKQYINFFISFTIYHIIALLLTFLLIGFVLVPIIAIAAIIITIIAAVKAYNGETYRIPLSIPFLQ